MIHINHTCIFFNISKKQYERNQVVNELNLKSNRLKYLIF